MENQTQNFEMPEDFKGERQIESENLEKALEYFKNMLLYNQACESMIKEQIKAIETRQEEIHKSYVDDAVGMYSGVRS